MTKITPQMSNFGTLHAIKKGQGKRLVFIHGVGLCHEAWIPQIEVFSDHYEVIALDLPGHGQSPLENAISFADFKQRLLEALEDMGEDYILIGHSLGALLSLGIAVDNPHHMRAFVCVNPVYQRDEAAREAVLNRAHDLRILSHEQRNHAPTLDRWYGNDYPFLRKQTEAWLNGAGGGYGVAYNIFAQYQDPSLATLKQITQPSLIITGEDDPNSTPEMTKILAASMQNAKEHFIKTARHMMPLTHAKPFNMALRHFLNEIAYV